MRKAVAARIETLRSVHERVALLAKPRRYIARSVFREPKRDRDRRREWGHPERDRFRFAVPKRACRRRDESVGLVCQPNISRCEHRLSKSRRYGLGKGQALGLQAEPHVHSEMLVDFADFKRRLADLRFARSP